MAEPGVVGTATGGRTGSGAFAVTPPAGAAAYLAVITAADNDGTLTVTPPPGWTLVGSVGWAGLMYKGTDEAGSSWSVTLDNSSYMTSCVVVGYDMDFTVDEPTIGTDMNSPAATASEAGLTIRTLCTVVEANVAATYPTAATIGRAQFQQWNGSLGYGSSCAVAHQSQAAGSTGTALWAQTDLFGYDAATTVLYGIAPDPGSAPEITTTTLNPVRWGAAFSQTLAATGDPDSWSIEAGALPAGQTLNTSTGEITGTPTGDALTYSVTIRATNSEGYDEVTFTGNQLLPYETSRTSETTDDSTEYLRILGTNTAQGNDPFVIWVPAAPDSSVFVTFTEHGVTSSAADMEIDWDTLAQWTVDHGGIWFSCDARGDSFGSPNAIATVTDVHDILATYWDVTKTVASGESAGALLALNITHRDEIPLAGTIIVDPATDLGAVWALGSYNSSIKSAYGFASDGDYATATAGYDPMLAAQSAWDDRPVFMVSSPGDSVATEELFAEPFADRITGHADLTWVHGTGGHLADYRWDALIPWLAGLFVVIFPTLTGEATASGGEAVFTGGGTLTTLPGEATAAGGSAAFAGAGTLTGETGSATAGGGDAAFRGSATIQTAAGEATAGGGEAALTGGATFVTTTGHATAAGGEASLTASALFITATGTATAAGGEAEFAGGATLTALTGQASAEGGDAQFTGGATLTTEPGEATAGGGPVEFVAGNEAIFVTLTGHATAAGGDATFIGSAVFVAATGSATASGGTATFHGDTDDVGIYLGSIPVTLRLGDIPVTLA